MGPVDDSLRRKRRFVFMVLSLYVSGAAVREVQTAATGGFGSFGFYMTEVSGLG